MENSINRKDEIGMIQILEVDSDLFFIHPCYLMLWSVVCTCACQYWTHVDWMGSIENKISWVYRDQILIGFIWTVSMSLYCQSCVQSGLETIFFLASDKSN
jgi:hypothetical protein